MRLFFLVSFYSKTAVLKISQNLVDTEEYIQQSFRLQAWDLEVELSLEVELTQNGPQSSWFPGNIPEIP